MNNLPDTVQWLLDFANLGSNPGELNPQKQDKILRLKRPPIEPSFEITSLKLRKYPQVDFDSNIIGVIIKRQQFPTQSTIAKRDCKL